MGSTIGAAVIAASIIGLFLAWRLMTSNWIAARLPIKRARKQRKSDKLNLNRHQRKIFNSARELHAAGKIESAAQMLESIGLMRQAVQMLEDNGYVNEAAGILIRMQRPNRAGYVYARNKKWKEALRCFMQADMPLEAAKCAWEAGEFKIAADNFIRAGRLAEAAECLVETGDLNKAAKTYTHLGDVSKAIDIYRQLVSKASDISSIELEIAEIELISTYLSNGNVDLPLADLLATRGKLGDVILQLTTKGLTRAASELYLRSTADLGPTLLSAVNYLDQSAKNLAEVFQNVSNFQYAGMVYQTLGTFDKAGEAFQKAEDFERAAYCYERAGNNAMVTEMRIRIASGMNPRKSTMAMPAQPVKSMTAPPEPPKSMSKTVSANAAFSLENITGSHIVGQNQMGNEERTEIVMSPLLAEQHTKGPNGGAADDVEYVQFCASPFIQDLSPSEKRRLWELGKTLTFVTKETVLDYNNEPGGIYFLISGQINSFLESGSDQFVKSLHEGESFCEFWVMAEIAPTVKFIAEKNCHIRLIPGDAFANLLEKDGTIARKLYKRFTRQIASNSITVDNNRDIKVAS